MKNASSELLIPLHAARWRYQFDDVIITFLCGCSFFFFVNSKFQKYYTLLICAAKNDRVDVVDFLLDTLEDVRLDAVDVDGQTALFHAAMGGHYQVVKRLVEAGASPDKRNKVSGRKLQKKIEMG